MPEFFEGKCAIYLKAVFMRDWNVSIMGILEGLSKRKYSRFWDNRRDFRAIKQNNHTALPATAASFVIRPAKCKTSAGSGQ
ncbi:MAG: hypothetical protein A2583_13590 [Bdellovibrionales bacterium RIFOXYD1_FULL_53_11]|nr:MAG: hypothetical protein A2583_13590 [Bdellovibrionales bacterium RIFOXYD1_FULL_53_11]